MLRRLADARRQGRDRLQEGLERGGERLGYVVANLAVEALGCTWAGGLRRT